MHGSNEHEHGETEKCRRGQKRMEHKKSQCHTESETTELMREKQTERL